MCAVYYYDELTRENSCCFKKKYLKMLTSFDNNEFISLIFDDSINNYSNGNNNDQLDSTISNKTKFIFQKTYFNEPIKSELIKVPSWRMKEKVIRSKI